MTDTPDTGSEAVERIAETLGDQHMLDLSFTAATLRALAAERDAAIARAESAEAERDALVRVAEAARRERRADMDGRSTPDTRAAARQALDEAVDALPPGLGQSED